MHVRVVREIEGFARLRESWQPLLEQSRPNHLFMTWEWLFTWWKHFGQDMGLFVLVIEDKGEKVGIVPLVTVARDISYGGKMRSLHFIGFRPEQCWNDWMDIIAIRKPEVLAAALRYLRQHQHLWDFIDLSNLPAGSETVEALSSIAPELGFQLQKTPLSTCPYISVHSGWEAYAATHPSKKVRADLERQIRRLSDQGELAFRNVADLDLPRTLDVLFDFKQRRQQTLNQPPLFKAHVRDFYRELAEVFPRQWVDCSVMTIDGKMVALHFGFRYNSRLYYYTPAFDPEYAAYSPGKVLLKHLIQTSFADEGICEFDFLRGREPYKYEWTTAERQSCAVSIANTYMSGWMGRVFRRSPLGVRRLLTRVVEPIQGAITAARRSAALGNFVGLGIAICTEA